MTGLCTVCGGSLDDERPVQIDLTGEGAHAECLETADDEGDDE